MSSRSEKLRISAPLSSPGEVDHLVDGGAGEIYFSYLSPEWARTYSIVNSPSRRYNRSAHLTSLRAVERVVSRCRSRGVPAFLAVNGTYSQEQYPLLLKELDEAASLGVDAVIVGDLALLLTLREQGFAAPLFMGTGGAAFNSEAAAFYESLGVRRIILPRAMTLDEIEGMTRANPHLDFEAFIGRGLCAFVDGFCRFQHGVSEALGRRGRNDLACGFRCDVRLAGGSGKTLRGFRFQRFTGCGVCALWHLGAMRVRSVKLVGREFSTREKLESLAFVAGALDALPRCGTLEEFRLLCQNRFRDFFERECTQLDCYYPEMAPPQRCE